MWNHCRSAALLMLQRTAIPSQRLALLSSVLRASVASAASSNTSHARQFATSSSLAGVELSYLLNSSTQEIKAELGRKKLHEVHRALKSEFHDVVASDANVDDLVQLFAVAQKTRLPALMLKAFACLLENHPESIDFAMYGEVFRTLSRERAGEQLWKIYESARPHFEPSVPEVIRRFGIVGKIEMGDMETAEQLLIDMENDGHFVSNETLSRVLAGYARAKNGAKVLEYFEKLDPRQGDWHESAIDRVILSLGVAGKPDLAFEFYVHSNMKLNGGTLIVLLSVCRHNDCFQQATDILENRKRFNLHLDARGYNAILETLEFLDRRDEIRDVLQEMNDEGVKFDTYTKTIVERNQPALKGTYFDLDLASQRSKGTTADPRKKAKAFFAQPELRNLLEENKYKEAAALADELVRPMTLEELPESKQGDESLVEGLLKVTPSLAKDVVSAFMSNNEVDKVDALLKGFEVSETNVGYALMEIVSQYADDELKRGGNRKTREKPLSRKQRELAYRAAKLMLHQDWQIHRAGPALSALRAFNDTDAVLQLFKQLLNTFTTQSDEGGKTTISAVNVSQTLAWTLRTLGENDKLDDALDLVEQTEQFFRLEPSHYIGLLTGMRSHSAHTVKNKGVVILAENYRQMPFYYLSDPFERVLDDMEKRGVRMTRSIVANLSVPLAGGNKRQRLRLLEIYAAARTNALTSLDSFAMPSVVYSVLMHVCGKETGDAEEIKRIYQEALTSLSIGKDAKPKRLVPPDWVFVLISQLADAGKADEAFENLLSVKQVCGMHSYEVTMKVLRSCITSGDYALAKRTMAILEERSFKPTLSDSYDIVHLARDHDMPEVAFGLIAQYESAHGRAYALGQAKSRQSARDKYAIRKISAMYRVVLKLCEVKGEWKRALALSARVNELVALENGEEPADKDALVASENGVESANKDELGAFENGEEPADKDGSGIDDSKQ